MHPVIHNCPICKEQLEVTQLHCRQCDTKISGHYYLGRFSGLTPEQMDFVELFVRCEGKINRVCNELCLSYPVVRAQLTDVIESMGYSIGDDEPPPNITREERKKILAKVSAGTISAAKAAELLRG